MRNHEDTMITKTREANLYKRIPRAPFVSFVASWFLFYDRR